jgi:hypothetical protein
MPILKRTIIGVILIVGLTVQATNAYAIYSPTISKRVSIIRQNVLSAREQNGVGSLRSARESLIAQDNAARAEGRATGLPAKASIALGKTLGLMFWETIQAPFDPVFMIFNVIQSTGDAISVCLRNDIWMLQDLRDAVSQEMIKSYLMGDQIHGDLLMDDYDYLTEHINILKKYGNHPQKVIPGKGISSQYLFGVSTSITPYSFQFPVEEVPGPDEATCKANCPVSCAKATSCDEKDECKNSCDEFGFTADTTSQCKNLCEDACDVAEACIKDCEDYCEGSATLKWGGCPQGEFFPAFNEVLEATRNLKTIGSFKAADWGSLWEMARARARRRADEWIKANQITLTIGGPIGGNPQSLIKGDGLNRFLGSLRTEGKILTDMIGPVIPLFTWATFETIGEAIGVGLGFTDPEDLTNNYCMYFDSTAQAYYACTIHQFLDYKSCVKNKAKAEKEGIDCDVFKNPSVNRYALDIVQGQREVEARHMKTVKRTETAYVYNLELSSINENNIEAIENILSGINAEITAAYKNPDTQGQNIPSAPLPTLYNKLSIFSKKHGGGK